ncbi:MAG TPA: alkaline phosphatase family protein, partial [Bryobacteraceae bacterium]|nr:alkaline phosphatase family protein [Bryobacteraceae bacterium]
TTTEYEEGVDIDQSQLNGGAPGEAPTDGDWKAIDPNRLPRDPYKGCGLDCSTIPDNNGGAWTDSFQNIRCYDQLKVNAILNWIDGKAHLGGNTKAPVPNLFGMNFQAVSVGQKLIENGVKGGYKDAAGTVTDHLKAEIVFVDAAIGQMVSELRHQGLLDKTLIIVTAKHGQSPIDPNRFQKIGAGITTTPADVIAGSLPPPPAPENPNTNPALNPIGPTQDDISLLWLDRQASVAGAVQALEASGTAGIGLGQIFFGPSLETMFNAPGLPPNGDPRSPDIVVQPNVGVIYTGSHKKQAEHGGFAQDDTNVMILVSNPSLQASTVTTFVETTQVAPTILEALGLDPTSLDAVQKEGTAVLPGLTLK